MLVAHAAERVTEERRDRIAGKKVLPRLVEEAQVDVHARAGPVVVRLGHEGGFEPMRSRRGLHRALQQQAVERGGDRIGAMLQIDLELAGTRLLHHRVDGETLHLANPVDVIDERRKRVHLLKAEGERPARIVGETFRGVKRECAIRGPAVT